MKKLLALILALSMIFVLGACDNGKEDPKPESQVVKVTFDTDGGSAISPLEIKKGSKVVNPAPPTKEGFDFVEWTKDGQAFDFETVVDVDITLKASWKAKDAKPDDSKPDDSKQDDKKDDKKDDKPSGVTVETLKWVNNWYWVKKGITGDPELTVVPESARSSVKFTSSDPEIATVDEKGYVKGIKGGKVTITAECGGKKAELPFEVREDATGIKLNKDVITLAYMSQYDYCDTLEATVEPEWAYNKEVKMYISDSSVAYFDKDGIIHALKPGKATITAEDALGHTATCQLYVNGGYLTYTYSTNQYYSNSAEEYYIWLETWKDGVQNYADVTSKCSMHGTATEFLKAEGGMIKSIKTPTVNTQTTVYFSLDSGDYAGLQTDDVAFTIFNY